MKYRPSPNPLPPHHRLLALRQKCVWVFDLDNTLYPVSSALFYQVDLRIRDYIANLLSIPHKEAHVLQKRFFRRYGTTMCGLMSEHQVDPDEFMAFVHNVDLRKLHGNPRLDQALAGLPGRKVIFTNASVAHAERITEHLGIRRHFCKVFDIRHSGFVPKPQMQGYERVLATLGEDPAQMVMVEDIARNLYPAAALGMTTVWLRGDSEWADAELEPQRDQAIHHITEDLPGWLLALPGSGPLAS